MEVERSQSGFNHLRLKPLQLSATFSQVGIKHVPGVSRRHSAVSGCTVERETRIRQGKLYPMTQMFPANAPDDHATLVGFE